MNARRHFGLQFPGGHAHVVFSQEIEPEAGRHAVIQAQAQAQAQGGVGGDGAQSVDPIADAASDGLSL